MRKQLKKNYDELCDKTSKYDEALLELLKQGHRALIIKTIKDYLQQHES